MTASETTLLGISALTGLGSIFIGGLSSPLPPRLSASEQNEKSPEKLAEWHERAEEALALKHDEWLELQERWIAATDAADRIVQQRNTARASAEVAALRSTHHGTAWP